MKKKWVVALLAAVLVSTLFLSACSASNNLSNTGEYYTTDMMAASSAPAAAPAAAPEMANNETSQIVMEDGATGGVRQDALQNIERKLIRTVYLGIEAIDFDAITATVAEQVAQLGGYVEQSELSNGNRKYNSGNTRYTHIVVRIPRSKVDVFVGAVGEVGNVTEKREYVEDVTLQYVDVESHKKALVIEQERLLALLEKAEKLEDIVALEARLSEVRYQLQSYESQLRLLDNQVDYSTITLDISEVQRITPLEEKTMWSRMQTGLSNSWYRLGINLQDFVVWFVVNLPYLVIWAVIITLACLVITRILRRSKRHNNKTNAKQALPPEAVEQKQDKKD